LEDRAGASWNNRQGRIGIKGLVKSLKMWTKFLGCLVQNGTEQARKVFSHRSQGEKLMEGASPCEKAVENRRRGGGGAGMRVQP
jgi:hypothetical protein